MKYKLKAKVVFEWEYEADSKNYGTDNVLEMVAIDKGGAEKDLDLFLDGCVEEPFISIIPVER